MGSWHRWPIVWKIGRRQPPSRLLPTATCRKWMVSDAPPVEAIEIAAYSPEWPVLFEASKELIVRALPGVALKIEHVGSTAVPNLAAKPIIDMDLIVDDPTREETYVRGPGTSTGCCGMTGPVSTCTSLVATAPSTPVTFFSGIGFGPTRRIAPDIHV